MRKLLFLLLVLLTNNAYSAEPARISVVDMQKLMNSSTAAMDIKERAKKERDSYQASISKEEDQLRKEEAKLQEQRSILTQEAFNDKARVFKDKVAKVQRNFQEKRAAQEESLKKSLDQVNQVVFEIIDSLAKEEGFDVTIPTSQILYATKSLDITEKVLERLNKKLPKLDSSKTSTSDKKETKKK